MNSPPTQHHIAFFQKAMGGGGAERVVAMLSSGLAARGHRVDLVLGSPRGPMLADVSSAVHVVDLHASRARAGLPMLLRLPGTARRLVPRLLLKARPRLLACLPPLVAYLRRERPEALLSTFGFNGLLAIWARELAGVPTRVVVREANHLSERVSSGGKPELRHLPRLIEEWYPRADAVVAVSTGVGEDLERTGRLARGTVQTIYNGVDTERIERLAREPVDHPWLAARDELPLLLSVGRLKPQKDQATLLRAFARVRARRPARLLLLGQGKERENLEALVGSLGLGDDVSMPGFVENPYAFMSRADLFVLSSRFEGAGNVLVEALAAGCPVVSTDCPSGPAELLGDGRFGSLVPPGDTDALADAIEASLHERHDPERGRERARAFSVERSIDHYLETLIPHAREIRAEPGTVQ